ncbi:MAG: hypothetical protein WBB28_24220 [Crinalium sp.]
MNNLTEGTNKNRMWVKEVVEPQVGQTSVGIPTIWVGFSVIAERCSEKTNWRRVCLDAAAMKRETWKNLPWKKFQKDLFRLNHASVQSNSGWRQAKSYVPD